MAFSISIVQKKVFLGPTLIDKQLRLWAAQSFQFNEWISLGLISCFLGPRSARGGRRRAVLQFAFSVALYSQL